MELLRNVVTTFPGVFLLGAIMTDEPLLTIDELASALKCSQKTIRRMINEDLIPYYDVLSTYRFKLSEVLDALKHTPEHLQSCIGQGRQQ